MLQLIRSSGEVPSFDDAYLSMVAHSMDLQEARHNVFLWRAYVLEHTAPMTFNLLKRRRLLKAELDTYIATHNLSPFRETHAPVFLDQLSAHCDPLVARVAQFERALHRVRYGDTHCYSIPWDGDPLPLLTNLAKDEPFDEECSGCAHVIVVARDLPGFFEVRLEAAAVPPPGLSSRMEN
jgi:hypothetical protein